MVRITKETLKNATEAEKCKIMKDIIAGKSKYVG